MGLLRVTRALVWRGIYRGIRLPLRITRQQCNSTFPPPTARPYSSSDTSTHKKHGQSRLRTLCDSRAQFCRRHAHRGKTPCALPLTSLVSVLHACRVKKEAYATVRREDAE